MDPEYRDGYVLIGDCLDRLKDLPDCSVDSVVTDPPYHLSSTQGHSRGFMGKQWDGGGIACSVEMWAECLRVLKPGGHLLAFGGTRTYHRMVCAIEDAGFEIRDSIHWCYGSGFPKSLNVGKAIDKQKSNRDEVLTFTAWVRSARDAAGITNTDIDEAFGFAGMAGHWTSSKSQPSVPTLEQMPRLLDVLGVDEMPTDIQALALRLNDAKGQPGPNWFRREVVGERKQRGRLEGVAAFNTCKSEVEQITAPATDAAQQWEGWGTALKPSHEPIVVARKPLAGTVAANVQQWGTGALNIDGCRVGFQSEADKTESTTKNQHADFGTAPLTGNNTYGDWSMVQPKNYNPPGRWPANSVFTHHADCVQVGEATEHRPEMVNTNGPLGLMNDDGWQPKPTVVPATTTTTTTYACVPGCPVPVLDGQSGKADSGGASRYFTQTTWDPQWDAPFLYVPKPSRRERNAGLDGKLLRLREDLDDATRTTVLARLRANGVDV